MNVNARKPIPKNPAPNKLPHAPITPGSGININPTFRPTPNISSLTNKIIAAIPDAIVAVDLEQLIIAINPAFTKLWGYSFGEVKGKSIRILFEKNERQTSHDPLLWTAAGEAGDENLFSRVYRRKDGTLFRGETNGSPIKDYHGNIIGYLGITRMDQFHQMRTLLQTNDALLTLTFEKATDPIVWIDPTTGFISNCNQAMAQLLKTGKDEIIGKRQMTLFSKSRQSDLEELLEKPIGSPSMESEIINSVGEKIPVRISASVFMFHKQTTIQCICHDLSIIKKAEQAITEANSTLEKKIRERTAELEKTNIALNILIKKGDESRKELAGEILDDIRELIDPYLHKLDRTDLSQSQRKYLQTISKTLDELSSPFIRAISTAIRQLTPTETKVAALIMQGKKSKDIADEINISPWTVDVHRRNIRKKCGFTNNRVNLRSALTSLMK